MVVPDHHPVLGIGALVVPDRNHFLLVGDEDCIAMLEESRILPSDGVAHLPDILLAVAVKVGAIVTCQQRHFSAGLCSRNKAKLFLLFETVKC